MKHKAEDLAWLAGMWSSEVDGELTEEFWMEPRGNMMPGVNRSFKKATNKSGFEYMRIAEGPDGLSFFASPSGSPPTLFPVKELKDQSVVFENLKNDFPTQIQYHRAGDTLHAKITGTINGKAAEMSWTWNRVEGNK
ncbi:MAG: DUF6265 family protein [Planctomycetota bacterium]